MRLRKGKTKYLLESSIDAALLATEIYNKPRTTFRCQNFVSLMIMSWTYLFHAHFFHTIGDRYYYRERNGRYTRVDGEKKAWDLTECINQYEKLREPIKANIKFFIGLRNKIEHRVVSKREIDSIIFGECQSLLYNYETMLIKLFGTKYSLNEHLVYSLQFSTWRTPEQIAANKKVRTRETRELYDYISKYRESLKDEVFNSQEYSIKLIQIPKVSNTKRGDLAIEFVNWNDLNEQDKERYNKVSALIKDKLVIKEALNVGRFKPGHIKAQVIERTNKQFNFTNHLHLYTIFGIRPRKLPKENRYDTNSHYCQYDDAHGDYGYTQEWIDFIVGLINSDKLPNLKIKSLFRANKKLDINKFTNTTQPH